MVGERITIKEALLCASAGLPIPPGRAIVGVVAKAVASEHTPARAVVYVKDDSGTVPVVYDAGPAGAVCAGQAIKCEQLCPRERAKRATVKYPLELVALSVVASVTPTSATMHQKTVEDTARSVRPFGTLGNTPEGQVVFENLLGLVVKVFARRSVTTKASRVVPKQSVLLTDGDSTVICTFWGSTTDITDSFVEKSTSLLHNHQRRLYSPDPTSPSRGTSSSSARQRGRVGVQGKTKRDGGHGHHCHHRPQGGRSVRSDDKAAPARKALFGSVQPSEVEDTYTTRGVLDVCGAVKSNSLVYGKVTGYVANVLFRKRMAFDVCARCQRAVRRDANVCPRCSGAASPQDAAPAAETLERVPVARATIALMDSEGTLALTLYGKVAEAFLGLPVVCLEQVGDELKTLVQRRVLWQRFRVCLRMTAGYRVRVMECVLAPPLR